MSPTFLVLLVLCTPSLCYFDPPKDSCFCQLSGNIDECSCNINTVDHFNNIKVYPRLRSLLRKDYFRFFKVNLKRECPFWHDDSKCAMKYCHVLPCGEGEVPQGIKGEGGRSDEAKCEDKQLDYLNTTISEKMREDLVMWTAYDDALDDFCVKDDKDEEAEYVDLLLNPERYTGYKGTSANRIWNSIYLENCFRPKTFYSLYIPSHMLSNMCLEERVYYRAISGLHSSINIHLCANYLLSNSGLSLANPKGEWGPNLKEFQRRFSPETTNGEGPHWLRNLYFVYLLELRALAKAAKYLEHEKYYTGDEMEDFDTQMAVKDLLNVAQQFSGHFDESSMFTGSAQAKRLKTEFKEHFRNVTRIMDCVGCDKCKLWGKLQTRGLGTALKILFSQNLNHKLFRLQREEIVALFNAFGRLSTSIYKLDDFRQMLRGHDEL
ncbi:ero1-like protein [Tribolium castaneum]|uniref:Ero1-like protein n=1 Tax=Tribolium castaneum TaxID=7070 RepID=D6WXL9_TRICA|nr:PREDICTED: ero1-like protein [Tribolium castaneum]EFA08867.1 Ero1-like protein [Tribolium castaneum]|eukprot:XP_972037.1 PREDICTED: ero1-like protein [Tribolium castaneum]